MTMTPNDSAVAKLQKSISAMSSIYGPLPSTLSAASTYTFPPQSSAHHGRYLWTDGFAVLNFLTIYTHTSDTVFLTLAQRLVSQVHSVLGYTRDLRQRLPGATDASPLEAGLRIGKVGDEDDPSGNGDGQYFHYLTVWMFALNGFRPSPTTVPTTRKPSCSPAAL